MADARGRGHRHWASGDCQFESSAGRRLRDRPYDGDLPGDVGDLMAPDVGHAFRHRDDLDADSVWEEVDAGPPGPPFQASPSLLGTAADDDLDVRLAHGEEDHHDHGKVQAADGRGPIIVRGPPFNSVAIGFLIYLILLAVLQSSIFNMTKKGGLLGLGLLPARSARDHDERVPGAAAVDASLGRERAVADLVGLAEFGTRLKYDPVLVAAVLNSEPGREGGSLGGPRRVRRHIGGERQILAKRRQQFLPP